MNSCDVATPADPNARHYWRAAHQRLLDARLIYDKLDRYTASIYLAGYAVECIMKALILARTSAGKRSAVLADFRGVVGHNLDHLRHLLGRRNVDFPPDLTRPLALVRDWSTDLRYDPGQGDRDDAAAFLDAARHIVDWCDGQM